MKTCRNYNLFVGATAVLFAVASVLRGAPAPATQPAANPAAKVVFVCDMSMRMLPFVANGGLQGEVEKAVASLQSGQRFGIVSLSMGKVHTLGKTLLKPSDDSTRKATEFLAVAGLGDGDVVAGIKASMEFSPDLIWLATSGRFNDTDRELSAIRKANTRHTPINTIAAFADSNANAGVLWRISQDGGGVCVGNDGKAIPNPDPPKPPATGPSIFQSR